MLFKVVSIGVRERLTQASWPRPGNRSEGAEEFLRRSEVRRVTPAITMDTLLTEANCGGGSMHHMPDEPN